MSPRTTSSALTEIWLAARADPDRSGPVPAAAGRASLHGASEIKLVLAKIAVKHVVRLDAESIRQGIIPGPPPKRLDINRLWKQTAAARRT